MPSFIGMDFDALFKTADKVFFSVLDVVHTKNNKVFQISKVCYWQDGTVEYFGHDVDDVFTEHHGRYMTSNIVWSRLFHVSTEQKHNFLRALNRHRMNKCITEINTLPSTLPSYVRFIPM